LPRTFSQQRWFREDPQSMMLLERTLGAYSVLEMKDGYCQSLNFIAGMLLITNEYQPVSSQIMSFDTHSYNNQPILRNNLLFSRKARFI
jgi:hypothetical protein